MANDTATEQPASGWHQVTLALLGGLTVASVASVRFAHIAVVQTPGLDPPPEPPARPLPPADPGFEAAAPSSNASCGRALGRSI